MARTIHLIDVSVTDRGAEREKRSVTVVIQAQQEQFMLSDLLAKEGAVCTLECVLRKAGKEAVSEYIESGKKFVKGGGGKGGGGTKERKTVGGQDKRTGATAPDFRV